MDDILLEVTDLTLHRSGTRVLDGLSWQTRLGQHWAILGQNGSGKTSLLSALCGLATPSGGELSLLGHRFGEDAMAPARRQVALVGSALRQMVEDGETVEEVLLSGLHGQINLWKQVLAAERKIARGMADRLGFSHLLPRAWGVISQGERQKVLIGRGLLAQPKILILDEPCAGLDPTAREAFLRLVSQLLAESTPQIVFVTHHIEEILPGITHLLGIQHGKVLFHGECKKMLTTGNLQALFQHPLKIRHRGGRYSLEMTGGLTAG
jgi:iron complex transport system ATP-binding protein